MRARTHAPTNTRTCGAFFIYTYVNRNYRPMRLHRVFDDSRCTFDEADSKYKLSKRVGKCVQNYIARSKSHVAAKSLREIIFNMLKERFVSEKANKARF